MLVPTAAHPLHVEGQFWAGGPDLVGPSSSPPTAVPHGFPTVQPCRRMGGDPTGKLHGAQAVLWSPIQGINTIFCFLDTAASWPCVHIQFAHFLSALTCVNLLKRFKSERANKQGNEQTALLALEGSLCLSSLVPMNVARAAHTMLSASPPLPQEAFAEL